MVVQKKQEIGGNIIIENFNLDNPEMIIAKKIIGKYGEKIRNFVGYDELRLEMKTHIKSKKKQFEVKALAIFNGNRATSEGRGLNSLVIIDSVLKKVLQEVEHKVKKGLK